MSVLLASLLVAAPVPDAPVDMVAAERALRAARDTIDARAVLPDCLAPFPLNPEDDSCDVLKAGIPSLDPRNLVYFDVSGCVIDNRSALCAVLSFDRGLAIGSRTTLVLVTESDTVRRAADITKIMIGQGRLTSD